MPSSAAPLQNQPSAIVRQLSEKVRTQAERLSHLESYRSLLEKRLLDFDPRHPLPVTPNHLGLKPIEDQQSSLAEIRKQLAIKE
jgi:hypothetical protein